MIPGVCGQCGAATRGPLPRSFARNGLANFTGQRGSARPRRAWSGSAARSKVVASVLSLLAGSVECGAWGREALKGVGVGARPGRGTRTARGETDIPPSASLPASAGRASVQPEAVRAELRLAVWRALFGSRGPRCSGFWAGRLRREGSRDELACPTRGQTNSGGQRMTGPQRRPASLRAFPELGPVMRWPGNSPVSAVFTQCSAAES